MRTHVQTQILPRFLVRAGAVVALALVAVASAPGTAAAQSNGPASIGRMRLSFSLVPAPLGSYETPNLLNQRTSVDLQVAFGLRPAFDYTINNYLFVGFAPQFMFNVKPEGASDSAKTIDLLVRVGGHAPVADRLHLYGYLAPGYSIVYPPVGNNDDAAGFVLGVAVGALYSINERLFASADIGYQIGYQEVTRGGIDVDARLSFLLVGLGIGMKL